MFLQSFGVVLTEAILLCTCFMGVMLLQSFSVTLIETALLCIRFGRWWGGQGYFAELSSYVN